MDPCGMIFDVVRSCYTTKALFVKDGHESTIRWYFAPDGALPFPKHHSFASLNWSAGSSAGNVVGEIKGKPRPWSNGATPSCACGTSVWGDENAFLGGAPAYLADPHDVNFCGMPIGCPVCNLCQPFYDSGGETTATLSLSWRSTVFNNFAQSASDAEFFTASFDEYVIMGSTAPECGDVESTDFVGWFFSDDPGIVSFELVEYDPMTFKGTFQAHDGSGPIPGYQVFFTLPSP